MINDNENEAAKIKSRSQRYNIKGPGLDMDKKILHLSNIWSSIHEELSWVELSWKKALPLKKRAFTCTIHYFTIIPQSAIL